MKKVTHKEMVFISGGLWLLAGLILFPMGLKFLFNSFPIENSSAQHFPLVSFFLSIFGGDIKTTVGLLILFSIFLGYSKGRMIFSKTVQRMIAHILSLPNPSHPFAVYDKKYLILLLVMFFLSFLLKFASLDVRGVVDVTVGTALLYGSSLYFRRAASM